MRNGSTVSTRPSTCQRVVLNSSQAYRAELKSSKILVYRPLARDSTDKLPIIVEPVSPRLRVHYVHSERSFSSVFHSNHLSYYCTSLHTLHPTSPASRPVSGWFQQALTLLCNGSIIVPFHQHNFPSIQLTQGQVICSLTHRKIR